MTAFFSWLVAVMLLVIVGIVLIGALFFCLGQTVGMLQKVQQYITYNAKSRRYTMNIQDVLNKIDEASNALASAFERVSVRMESAVSQAVPPEQLASATSKLQQMIDSANQIAAATATPSASPASSTTPVDGTTDPIPPIGA